MLSRQPPPLAWFDSLHSLEGSFEKIQLYRLLPDFAFQRGDLLAQRFLGAGTRLGCRVWHTGWPADRASQARRSLFAIGVAPAVQHAALDLQLMMQLGNTLPLQDALRHLHSELR